MGHVRLNMVTKERLHQMLLTPNVIRRKQGRGTQGAPYLPAI
jgi:hypothetical protein